MAPSRKKPDEINQKKDALLDAVASALLAGTGSRRKKSTRKTLKCSSKKLNDSEKSIKPSPLEWKGEHTEDDPTDADLRLREFMQKKRSILDKDGTPHFYEDDGRCYTLEEIGQVMGVTRERVRQVEENALRKMWRLIRSMNTREDLEQGDWLDMIGKGHKNESIS